MDNLKAILLGIASFFLVTMSLYHVFFKGKSDDYISHYKTYNSIIKNRDNISDILINKLDNNLITKEAFVVAITAHKIKYNNKLKVYTKKKKG